MPSRPVSKTTAPDPASKERAGAASRIKFKVGTAFGTAEDDAAGGSLVLSTDHRDQRHELVGLARLELSTREEFVGEIARLWKEAQDRFLLIGRYLLDAKARLDHGAFGPMVASELPFTHSVAVRLMAVARAVEDGIVAGDRLPKSYSVAYEIVSMRPEELEEAKRIGLVRPDVRREDVVAFKRGLRSSEGREAWPREMKRRRLERLLTQKARLEEEIALLRRELDGRPAS